MPLLNPAPPWKPPRSDRVVLWHGCTAFDKDAIEKNGIDLKYCAVDTDFERGFYTTTLERQARQWAWNRFYRWQKDHPTVGGNQPVVLRFCVRPWKLSAMASNTSGSLNRRKRSPARARRLPYDV